MPNSRQAGGIAMADIVIGTGQSVPETTKIRYEDMGDGTHALVVVMEVG